MPRSVLFVALLLSPLTALAADWPQFRGPDGQGHSAARNVPITWSEQDNITWKIDVPGSGWSSPSIQDGQIWLTSALDEGRSLHALCYDRSTGRLLHDVEVFQKDDPGRIHKKNSHASPTPVLEPGRVYLHFGAHGTACLSTAGEILWKTNELRYEHRHGPGGSPVIWRDLLISNCDGTDVQFVVALDKATGAVRWKKDRQHISEARRTGKANAPMAYSTPLSIEVDGQQQLISAGSDHVVAYDPANGEEIWWSTYYGYSNVPRPVFGKGMIFVSSGYDGPNLYAIRVGGKGDVTETHVAWTLKKGGSPLNPSPLLVGDELYVVSDAGIATCLDAVTGKQHWQQRLGGAYSASPVLADGNIYYLSEDGLATVIKAGTTFEKLADNPMEERCLASPAIVDGAIFLRTAAHLFRIEKK